MAIEVLQVHIYVIMYEYVEVASPDFMTNYFCILTNRHCYNYNESLIF